MSTAQQASSGDGKVRDWTEKLTTPEIAVKQVKSGNKVFIGTACATPRKLAAALETLQPPPHDVQIYHFLTNGAIPSEDGVPKTNYHHCSFFVGTDTRDAVHKGVADYIPISIVQAVRLIETGRIKIDVAMVQVSPPDEYGFVSLGVSVDITHAVIHQAKRVIAEVNPNMPRTMGDSFIHLDKIDQLVMVEDPIIEYTHEPADAVAKQIARYIAGIIDDGSTLQIGLGRIPNEALKYICDRRDLGIHSDVITEPIVDLVEQGVITGKKKSIHKDKVVASYCMGTHRLYEQIDSNPMFSFHPIEYVCSPSIIAQNDKLVSITQAFSVDLTGQICADQFEGRFYSGVSTQPDFLRAAAQSEGGKPVICFPSTTDGGETSRIRPLLLEGEGVTIARSDVHYVVTEFGIAYLFGKSVHERALALIEIAHPKFRPWLLEEAKRLRYVRDSQVLESQVAYPVEEERKATLKGGRKVMLRPAKASDVQSLQEIFYHLPETDVYTRFFSRLKELSNTEAQRLCNVNYDTEVAFLAVTGDRENEEVVGSSCYFVNPSTNMAEVAYMILPDWQSSGLGTALQQRMMEYAKSKGIRGFMAEILAQNHKMVSLARRACDNVSISRDGNTIEVSMFF